MAAEVYLADLKEKYDDKGFPKTNYPEMVRRLFREAKLNECIGKGDLVAIKVPLGALYRTYSLDPGTIRSVVDEVREAGGIPFVAETLGWHHAMSWSKGSVGLLNDIVRKGYSQLTLGAPLIIADGLKSIYKEVVKIDGLVLKEVHVAGDIYHADAMIVFSHFTGHPSTGYAGALKNMAMGCVSRSGKMLVHTGGESKVRWNEEKCIQCLKCLKMCASAAISHVDKKIVIDEGLCIGCQDCVVYCPAGALWMELVVPNPEELACIHHGKLSALNNEVEQIKMADSVKGVLATFREVKVGFITDATDIPYECDCSSHTTVPIITDVGYLASRDAVAIDKAAIDLAINRTYGYPGGLADKLGNSGPGVDKLGEMYKLQFPEMVFSADYWRITVEAAERNRLGGQEYELKEI